MGNGSTKPNENVYFQARKRAAMYNDNLSSRERASELLGISASTLADYELGLTKFIPVDKVVLMADLYNAPELKASYCKCECPIGKRMPLATEIQSIEKIVIQLLDELDSKKVEEIKGKLIGIAAKDLDTDSKNELKETIGKLERIAYSINELRLAGEKMLRE